MCIRDRAVGEQANVFPRQFAAVRLDPIMVGQTETEVPHEQALCGWNALLLQKRGNVALTDRDGTAQPPFAQTVCALTASERQQFRICAGRDFEDSSPLSTNTIFQKRHSTAYNR